MIVSVPPAEGSAHVGDDPRHGRASEHHAGSGEQQRLLELAFDAIGGVSRRRFIRPENADGMPRAERDALAIDEYAHTRYHPVGTARMGRDAASVVDEHLRVRGVEGLRVADASVMPTIIRGHTNAAAMVIGEWAADLIGRARS